MLLLLSLPGLLSAARADTGEEASFETLAIPFPFYTRIPQIARLSADALR